MSILLHDPVTLTPRKESPLLTLNMRLGGPHGQPSRSYYCWISNIGPSNTRSRLFYWLYQSAILLTLPVGYSTGSTSRLFYWLYLYALKDFIHFKTHSRKCGKRLLVTSYCLLPVCLSGQNSTAPNGRIHKIFDIWGFYENLSWKITFH